MDSLTKIMRGGRTILALLLSWMAICLPAQAGHLEDPDTIAYVDRQTDGNLVGLNVTNYGFIGNDLITRDPSMEYPLGSQVDHLIRAGPWIAAVTVEGDTLVTTGAVDGYYRTGGTSVTEFTPRTRSIIERSNLIHRSTYSPDAVSEQDFICRYDDLTPKFQPNVQPHWPLGVEILQKSYLWSTSFADAFVILSFDIKNVSGQSLTNVYLGMYIQLVSGNKGAFERWPPSGWFRHNVVYYEEDLHMVLEHDATFSFGTAPFWGGMKYLGTRPEPGTERVTFNWWEWGPGNTSLNEDVERYERMSNGEVDDVGDVVVGVHSPIEMISIGPYPILRPDSTIQMVFAFVCGGGYDDIRTNGEWAQRAYDHDYVLPSPPPSPRLCVRPGKNRIELWWDGSPESVVDPFDGEEDFEGYRIYVTRKEGALAEEFALVQELDQAWNTVGYNTGFAAVLADDPLEIDGYVYPYRYVLGNLKDGFKYWVAVTSFDRGRVGTESLESGIAQNRTLAVPGPAPSAAQRRVTVFPNPYRGEAIWDGSRERERVLWFANLPPRAKIRIYSLSGDLVDEIHFDGDAYVGENVLAFRPGEGERQVFSGSMCAWDLISRSDQPVASGLYLFTVTDETSGEVSVGKFMVVR